MLILKIKIEKAIQVDDEDLERLSKLDFYIGHGGYVYIRGDKQPISLHRYLMNDPKGMWIDHSDGNIYNNQKSNLRICNPSQSRANSRKTTFSYKQATSKYKGVHQKSPERGWSAEVQFKGKRIYLGDFETPELAAKVRDEKAKELQGEFALTNFK